MTAETAEFSEVHQLCRRIIEAMGHRVVGQDLLKRRLLTALISEGHILLEGVPGLGKTLAIKTLAEVIDAKFHRIQFTPDLLPSDIIGTEVYRPQLGDFIVRPGPIFANLVLADEINRAPAKVQSALLETMQEKQVTIGEQTLRVPDPFFVMATQNPIEQEGTYSLPEAQVDRFLMKLVLTYPLRSEEKEILDRVASYAGESKGVAPVESSSVGAATMANKSAVASITDLARLKQAAAAVYVDDRIKNYIVDLVGATRHPQEFGLPINHLIELGASPRAALSLFTVARTEAFISGEKFVVPEHIKEIAHDVMRHRLLTSYEAEAQGLTADNLIDMVLETVPVP